MADGDAGEQLKRWGLLPMRPELAVAAMGQAVDRDETCTAVADVDWRQFAATFTIGRPSPLLSGVAEARQALDVAAARPERAAGRGLLADRLAGLTAAEQERVLLGVICEQAATVLGHESADAVRPAAVFRDLGFDSLTAVEFRDQLAAATGLGLSATLVFDYPTPLVLAGWLRAQITGVEAAGPVLAGPVVVAGDPVAVVAMGCRFPGDVAGPEDLWELVRSGTDAISGFPADRGWEIGDDGFASAGGFVYAAAEFDAGFFGISPREALVMDPQQRLLLEVSWEAIERAGIDPASLRGSRTGVFAGTTGQDYPTLLTEAAAGSEGYLVTGNAASVVSGRVSYVLGLEGPAVSVDTACSSSLVALHLACQALRAGECDLALAGGVTVMATPVGFAGFAAQGGLAADGRCKAFGAGADGMGWAEGAGMLLVERLSDARRLGHPVLAVVAGSAVNQDGASNGLTAPNGPSQQRVIRAALASAGLSAADVDVVEAHGTGTVLGDPIEAQALIATYGRDRDADHPLWLGSVKSNIGHTQAAAGAAGLIKMIMAMRAGALPPTLHAGEPSPHIDWSAGTVRLLTAQTAWPDSGRARRAGVSSFGISGTNAHVIVEEPPVPSGAIAQLTRPAMPITVIDPRGRVVPWVVSGRGEDGLRAQAGRLADFARNGCGGAGLEQAGLLLATGRSAFEDRAVVLARSTDGFAAGLEAVAAGEPAAGVVTGRAAEGGAGKVVFVFPGQGGQWAGMAAELIDSCPAFAGRLAECIVALQPHVDWPVAQTLRGADEQALLERVDVTQPALWAVMVALAAAWQSLGVVPDAVAGHSQGEIAAAAVAGILPLTEAARVVAVRSKALARLGQRDGEAGGAMAAVAWSAAVAARQVARYDERIWVAAVNGPKSVVLAGNRTLLTEVLAAAEADGVWARWLQVGYASHGPQVDEIREELQQALAQVTPLGGGIPFWSSVTGELTSPARLDGQYWIANLRDQVRFDEVIRGLAGAGHGVFVEVSPHPVLVTAIEQTMAEAGQDEAVLEDAGRDVAVRDDAGRDDAPVIAGGTLRRADGGADRLLTAAAELFVRGVPVNWRALFPIHPATQPSLPTYAFQRQRYWPEVTRVAGTGAGEPRYRIVQADVEPVPDTDRSPLAERLAGRRPAEQDRLVLEVVSAQVAAVLNYGSADEVRPRATFRDVGFDSVTAVALRDKLATVTGLRLPATLVFDYPTPQVLARWLRGQITGVSTEATAGGPKLVAGDPVAVVAMSCRFPGGVRTPEELWQLIRSGTDAISPFPADRGWEFTDAAYAPAGGFLYDMADFDAGFFGISPREAVAMDPQQRLLLEVCWETVERAGIDPATLRGSRTGMFTGIGNPDYPAVLAVAAESSAGYLLTGTATSVASGRVSYVLGLEGPAVSVDTACSSSLVALHLACQSLRAGECDMALAGGATIMATQAGFGEFSAQGGLAADGRCKAFGAGADGIGWAEGAGIVLVERLSDARRNGHPVLAVIAGSAVNQDGASNGLTAPNGPSQQRVIRAALASAGLSAHDVDAVEAHGTGTVLGDPIEAQALIATYGQGRAEDRPLWLGSVKSNFGHTQAAAGVAGVMKIVLALGAGVLPPTLHAGEPSAQIDWSAGAVRVLTEERDWPDQGRPRRAGVSSFGISGTNAHVIVEQAPAEGPAVCDDGPPGLASGGVVPWVVSARDEAALRGQAGRLAGFARSGCGGGGVVDAGWSLAAGRSVFAERAVVLAPDAAGFAAGLAAVAGGEPRGGVVAGRAPDGGGAGKVVFVFPGQGGQWAGMARELAQCCPAFADRLAECAAALQPHVDWDVARVLAGADEQALEQGGTAVVQPVLWAVMVALAAAWESLGVTADAVAGHSQGEIAAAVVAGILTVEEAARVVAVRSRALAGLPAGGGMAAVAWPEAAARERLTGYRGRVWVAAVNGPSSVVLAGDREPLAEIVAGAEGEGTRVRWLPVSYASHGPGVHAVAGDLTRDLAGTTPAAGPIPFWSAVTGDVLDGARLDGTYWVANLLEQVRFEQVIRGLAETGHGVFVEVSPHPVLTVAIEQTLAGAERDDGIVVGTLRRGDGGPGRLLTSAAEAFVGGVEVDWARVFDGSRPRQVPLPTYAFQRQRYWPARRPAAVGGDVHGAGLLRPDHPLLGAAVELPDDEGAVFTGLLSLAAFPWLSDYAIFGTALLPGAAMAELAAWVGALVGCPRVDELTLDAPLALPGQGGIQVQLRIGGSQQEGRRPVSLYSREDGVVRGGWVRRAAGLLGAGQATSAEASGQQWPPPGAVPEPVEGFYAGMAERGHGYGPAFQGLTAAWRRAGEVFAEVRLPGGQHDDAARYRVHPALLDAALHAASLLSADEHNGMLPVSWHGIQLTGTGAQVLRVRLSPAGDGELTLLAADEAGHQVVSVDRLAMRPVSPGQIQAPRTVQQDSLFTVEWAPVTGTATVPMRPVGGAWRGQRRDHRRAGGGRSGRHRVPGPDRAG